VNATLEQVAEIVARQLNVSRDDIDIDTPFMTDLGADSLDHEALVIAFEKAFSLRFPAGAAKRVQTIGQVVELIEATAKAA
jgi:acyl carrier protein